jgi:hypothetical protein
MPRLETESVSVVPEGAKGDLIRLSPSAYSF